VKSQGEGKKFFILRHGTFRLSVRSGPPTRSGYKPRDGEVSGSQAEALCPRSGERTERESITKVRWLSRADKPTGRRTNAFAMS
jgi:hypothetical protein